MYWNYEALGYIFMRLTTLAAIPVFEENGFQKRVRIAFMANALVTALISFVYFYPVFSDILLMLGLPWAIAALLSILIFALMLREKEKDKTAVRILIEQ